MNDESFLLAAHQIAPRQLRTALVRLHRSHRS
jgi:hypothetical protein